MKNLVIAVALVMIVAAVPAVAQNTITVNVPFQFQVGDKLMPAGEYRISGAGEKVVVLQASSGKDYALALTNAKIAKEVKDPSLGFRKYGERYILCQAWLRTSDTGRSLLVTGKNAEMQTASLVWIRPMGASMLTIRK